MGLDREVNIFVNVYEWKMCAGERVGNNIQSAQCFFFSFCFFLLFRCLPRCMKHKRPFMSYFFSSGSNFYSCSESVRASASLSKWGIGSVGFESVTERERGQLHKHPFSHQLFIPRQKSEKKKRKRTQHAFICKC